MKKRLSQQSLDTGFEMGYRYGLQEGIDILNDIINKVEENNEHLWASSYSGGRVKASELIDLLKLCPPDRQVVVELKSGKDVFHTVTGIACNKKDIILRYHPKRKRR